MGITETFVKCYKKKNQGHGRFDRKNFDNVANCGNNLFVVGRNKLLIILSLLLKLKS